MRRLIKNSEFVTEAFQPTHNGQNGRRRNYRFVRIGKVSELQMLAESREFVPKILQTNVLCVCSARLANNWF